MNKEIWKDVKDYEGLYQVSNLGNIRSIKYRNRNATYSRIRNLNIQKTGNYNHILLTKNGVRKNQLIHRLVAQAFVSNPQNYKCVNHKDENARNNNANNLEWCSHKYNVNYGSRTKRVKDKMSISIIQLDTQNNIVRIWECMNDAIRYYNNIHIFDVCKGLRKKASGYIWKYNN